MKRILTAGALLALAACGTSPPAPSTGPTPASIIQLTHTDLQNAAAISKMFNDMDHGVECYTFLDTNLTTVQQLFGAGAPTNVSGLFSALEAANVGVNIAEGNSPQLLTLRYQAEAACGPYVMNLAGGIAFLAGKAQGIAATAAPLMAKPAK
jgi:hypothetical protein